MATDPRVAVVGSYTVRFTMTVPRFPTPGETVMGEGFAEGFGGKGSNQAIAAARLGADTTMIGRVGEDRYGDDALDRWAEEGVDATHVTRDGTTHTGSGFVIVDDDGENESTVAPGANERVSVADVRRAADAIEASDALLVQLGIPTGTVEAAVSIAANADSSVILNPAPARGLPASLLDDVTHVTPNQPEARVLSGNSPDADLDDATVANRLLDLGVDTVVVTRGADGASVVSDETIVEVSAPSVPVVDTTGAGDAFNGAFAVALAERQSLVDAVRFGCCAGAEAVTALEGVPGLPSRSAVEDRLGALPE